MKLRSAALVVLLAAGAAAQKYTGPRPSRPDLPFLKHADNLVATEATEAKEEKGKKDEITYVIAGAESSAKTPLAAPIFLVQCDKLVAEKIQLFKLDVKSGRRELTVSTKRPGKAIRLEVTRLTSDGLFRLEVNESLEPGEYSLSPSDSNQAFCFQVF
jgi:hypothetical protein